MKYNKNIAFQVIVISKQHFKKENQLSSKFGWVVELRNFTVFNEVVQKNLLARGNRSTFAKSGGNFSRPLSVKLSAPVFSAVSICFFRLPALLPIFEAEIIV